MPLPLTTSNQFSPIFTNAVVGAAAGGSIGLTGGIIFLKTIGAEDFDKCKMLPGFATFGGIAVGAFVGAVGTTIGMGITACKNYYCRQADFPAQTLDAVAIANEETTLLTQKHSEPVTYGLIPHSIFPPISNSSLNTPTVTTGFSQQLDF